MGGFLSGLAGNQRLGQAFFNALSPVDKNRLRGTLRDPFYKDGHEAQLKIHNAIEYLLDTE